MKKRLSYRQRQARKEMKKMVIGTLIGLPVFAVACGWAWVFGGMLAR